MASFDLSGEWRSTYYFNKGSSSSQHLLRLMHSKKSVSGISSDEPDGSKIVLELELDQEKVILTGTWRESTSPAGQYKGSLFHGAVQFILNSEKTAAEGMWVGFNTDKSKVNSGVWKLEKLR